MKNKILYLWLFALVMLFACRKDSLHRPITDNYTPTVTTLEAFTRLPVNADKELNLIVANIISAEEQHPFIEEYARKNGYPVWEKTMSNLLYEQTERSSSNFKMHSKNTNRSVTETVNTGGFFTIPLIDTVTREVTAYIACEKKNDTAYIYRTYNKREILETRPLSDTQRKNIRPLLAMFAYMEKEINGRKSITYYGDKEYHFDNINILHGNQVSQEVVKTVQSIQKRTNSLAMPCPRVILDIYIEEYDNGYYEIVIVMSDCLTLPSVTVSTKISKIPSGGGDGGIATGSWSIMGMSPGSGGYTVGGGGSYTGGAPQGWQNDPWNIFWTNTITNIDNDGTPGRQGYGTNPYFIQLNTLSVLAGLSQEEVDWLNMHVNRSKIPVLLDRLEEYQYSAEGALAVKIAIWAAKVGFLGGSYLESALDNVLAQTLPPAFHPFINNYKYYLKRQMAIERQQAPNASTFDLFLLANMELLHLGLDIAGLTPGVGEIFDLINGGLYALQGDWSNASLSLLSTVPFGGTIPASARIIKNGRRFVAEILDDGMYKFPENYPYLRKVLGTNWTGLIAHHIIPLSKQKHPLVQAAAKNGFDINAATNGIPLSSIVHTGNHAVYSTKLENYMTQRFNTYTNITPQQAKAELESLINTIRNWIAAHPTSNIDNITF